MSDIPNLEILSNVNAKYNSATFKTATFESATINAITLPGDKPVIVNNAAWNEVKTDIANSVSKTNKDLQTIAGTIQVTSGVNSDIFRSASNNSITAFTYVSNKGFDYSNIYQMKAYGKTNPFFKIDNGNITFEATNVKGTTLFEGGKALSEVYLKKGAIPADVYSKTDIDGLLAKKADKATTLSGYGITDAYTKTAVDTELAKKVNTTTLTTELAKKQDTLKVNSNIFAGENVNITQSASGAITISSTGGGSGDTYSKAEIDSKVTELNTSISKKQNTLTAGSNISITQTADALVINTKDVYSKAEIDSKVTELNTSISKKQNTLTAGSNISITQTADALVINTKDVYSKAEIDSKVTTLQTSKQDTLIPGTNLIEGDNVTITKDTTSGKITISALADLTEILNRISALENQLGGYTLKSVTQSEYDSLTTKDTNTLYLIRAS